MITTHELKRDMMTVFRTGNPNSTETILVMGSCRIVAYMNYLEIWNRTVGNNRFLIYGIDPFNFNWDPSGNLTDITQVVGRMETNENLLKILSTIKIFIHEYFSHFGMFNVDPTLPKHIYQFGMKPEIDVTLPNFHDVFILLNDFAKFPPFKEEAAAVRGQLTAPMLAQMAAKMETNIKRFYDICSKTSFPQMADYFRDHFRKERMFWTFNHVSKHFTLPIWRFLNEGYLHLQETDSFKAACDGIDILANPHTPICKEDVDINGFQWGEPLVNFAKWNKFA